MAVENAATALAQALGHSAAARREFLDLSRKLVFYRTAEFDEDGDRQYRGLRTAPDLHDDFSALENGCAAQSETLLSLARWPHGTPFALFLSHDIDQIHDRELFRILADINHVRRRFWSGETGNAPLACRRIARAVFKPKRALLDFETILGIEKRHGFRSTFFLLHDRYWARQGARFSFADKEIQEIGRLALAAGCELGVHGGYYRFNDAAKYRESKETLATVFGVEPVGIRNHLLRFSYPETWRAQQEAGFEYDATYGFRSVPGPRAGLALPFFPFDTRREEPLTILELPLAVMDTSIFRYLRLQGEAALEFTWQMLDRLANRGALVSLLWHNNFFNEPEYWDWQMVYERLLERFAALRPWCVTGAEINQWWRSRAKVSVSSERREDSVRWRFHSPDALDGLTVRLRSKGRLRNLSAFGAAVTIHESADEFRVIFPKLPKCSQFELSADLSTSG